MHQTKKGNQWYFGMKAHIGMDADSGLVHAVRGTSANVNDVVEANSLLHGKEVDGYGDAGYQGADQRPDMPTIAYPVCLGELVDGPWPFAEKQPIQTWCGCIKKQDARETRAS